MVDRSSFVVVANRLPVDEVTTDTPEAASPAPAIRAADGGAAPAGWSPRCTRCSSSTTAPGSAGPARPAPAPEPFELDGIQLHPVPLSAEELERYYEGQSNATIWPLYHDAVETAGLPPALARGLPGGQPALRRGRRRGRRARARPSGCRTTSCSWCRRCCASCAPTCGSASSCTSRSRRSSCSCSCRSAPRSCAGCSAPTWSASSSRWPRRTSSGWPGTCSACAVRRATSIEVDGRKVQGRRVPDLHRHRARWSGWPPTRRVQARAEQIRAELGDPKTVILGVDRLDYTKGIEHRLKAFRELLADGRLTVPDTVMVQVATPSRERVEHYQALRVKVEREVGRINGEFGRVGVPAVHYLHQSYSRSELAALYCAADVMVVTPLRDGMNLVAKEYVAARADHGGALVLSEFAGAAAELRQAFLCNPHDLDGVKDALLRAVTSTEHEARRRMQRHAAAPAPPRRRRTGPRTFLTALGDPRHHGAPGMTDRSSTATAFDPELRAAIGAVARVPQLLVACDYDGTLAPIVDDPTHGRAAAGGGRRVCVAGRAAADHRRGGLRPGAARPGRAVPAAQRGASGRQPRLRVRRRLRRAARARAGRAAQPAAGRAASDRRASTRASGWRASRPASPCTPAAPTRTSPTRCIDAVRPARHWPGVHVTTGKEVIELSVLATHKGTAIDELRTPGVGRARCCSSATTSPTRTRSRSCTARTSASRSGPGETGRALPGRTTRCRRCGCWRCCWRPGGTGCSASGRCRSSGTRCSPTAGPSRCSPRTPGSAGCATRGRTPRRSSPTCSAARPAGHFTVAPAARRPSRSGQRYRPGTMTVETRWSGLTVTDWLDGDQPRCAALDPAADRSVPVGRVRAPARVRPGAGAAAAARRRAAGARLQRADRAVRPRRRVGRRRRRRARHRPRRRSTSPRPAARSLLELRLRSARPDRRTRCRRPSGWTQAEQPWREWAGIADAARRSTASWCCAAR